jgi:glycosyltransferase involved in cell wall biosynthesis
VFGAEGSKTDNGKNIILTDDPEEYAEAILKILDNPEYGRSVAENAYQTFLENYTVERCAEALIQSYR